MNIFEVFDINTKRVIEDADAPALRLEMADHFKDLPDQAFIYYSHYLIYTTLDRPNWPDHFDEKAARYYERGLINAFDNVYHKRRWPSHFHIRSLDPTAK